MIVSNINLSITPYDSADKDDLSLLKSLHPENARFASEGYQRHITARHHRWTAVLMVSSYNSPRAPLLRRMNGPKDLINKFQCEEI